ncbi:transmembrane protein [Cystoisospora suis]|uniref:Transmembrane protein n=1 Tax=Cystoisospora suis TaxID=483139 RepID=A0A2C6LGF7_9APIC|nr:transmembrane protein [Cystoisospora suis]
MDETLKAEVPPRTPLSSVRRVTRVDASRLGLRGFAIIYGAMCVYLLMQTPKELTVEGYRPAAMSWMTAASSVGLVGCIIGFLLTFESCRTRLLGSLAVLSFTVSFILAIISIFVVCFTYFSVFWIIFSALHIFLSLMCSGAAYGTVAPLIKAPPVDETTPLTISQVTGEEAA